MYVAVFYSASWCGPCKQFIPVLEEFYNKMQKKGKKFEIVWVSVNRDETDLEFEAYFKLMPWLACPLDFTPQTLALTADKFNLNGIPYLVILDGYDGSIISLEGRQKVLSDSYGLEFPWRTRSLMQLLPRSSQKKIRQFFLTSKNKFYELIHPRTALMIIIKTVSAFLNALKWSFQSLFDKIFNSPSK